MQDVSFVVNVLILKCCLWSSLTKISFLYIATDAWLANPALPDDILKEAVPGNIRRAEHFIHVLRRLVQYLEGRLDTENVEKESPVSFVVSILNHAGIDQKALKFCYDRLHSLMMTLEITDTDEFLHIQTICDFATLVGTYARGFSIIIEPFDERMPHIPDPVLQVSIVVLIFIYSICCFNLKISSVLQHLFISCVYLVLFFLLLFYQ